MTTTDKVTLAVPIAKARYASIGGGPAAGDTAPLAISMNRVIATTNKPKTNRNQALIDASALKIGGISSSFLILILR